MLLGEALDVGAGNVAYVRIPQGYGQGADLIRWTGDGGSGDE